LRRSPGSRWVWSLQRLPIPETELNDQEGRRADDGDGCCDGQRPTDVFPAYSLACFHL